MDGDFTLDKPGFYTPQVVEENDFINERLENTDYGIYYSVKFENDAETYMWQAKTAPVKGEKYYGHIEKTKNGKSLRFKKDKLPEGENTHSGSPAPKSYSDNSKNITLGLVWKTIAGIRGLPEPGDQADFAKFYQMVNEHYSELILMQEKSSEG